MIMTSWHVTVTTPIVKYRIHHNRHGLSYFSFYRVVQTLTFNKLKKHGFFIQKNLIFK